MDTENKLKIKQTVDPMDGWLSDNEGEILYDLAKQCTGKGAIVEIGSWKGKSTIWLAKGSEAGKNIKVTAIDPHMGSDESKQRNTDFTTLEEFKANIKSANVDHLIDPIVQTSEEAAKEFNEPIELIFIDGSHQYDPVKLDWETWFPKVVDGGVIAFHDTVGHIGPRRVVNEYVYPSKQCKNIRLIDEITYATKTSRITFIDRIQNYYGFFIKKLSEWAVQLKLPKPLRNIGKKIVKKIQ